METILIEQVEDLKRIVDYRQLVNKQISLDGEIYIFSWGVVKNTTRVSYDNVDADDNTIYVSEEKIKGVPYTFYRSQSIETLSEMPEDTDIQDVKLLTTYQNKSVIYDYMVVPTIDNGPKLIKTFLNYQTIKEVTGYCKEHTKDAGNLQNSIDDKPKNYLSYRKVEAQKTIATFTI